MLHTLKNVAIHKLDCSDVLIEIILDIAGCEINERITGFDECRECYTSIYGRYSITYPCGHIFHRNCIIEMIKKNKSFECTACTGNLDLT